MCALDEALLARSQLGKQQTARAVQSIQLPTSTLQMSTWNV